MHIDPLNFARASRVIASAARRLGVEAPSFRSPPRLGGVDRTIRRRPDGTACISVAVRGRPWLAILADMVEGVVVANHLKGPAGDRCRTAIWRALTDAGQAAPGHGVPQARGASQVEAVGHRPALRSA